MMSSRKPGSVDIHRWVSVDTGQAGMARVGGGSGCASMVAASRGVAVASNRKSVQDIALATSLLDSSI